jgi:hypothetical protein
MFINKYKKKQFFQIFLIDKILSNMSNCFLANITWLNSLICVEYQDYYKN